jgi:DinB superfamily
MTITPDTKDWTWVVELRCPECGFDASAVPATEVAARLRAELPLWEKALTAEAAAERPDPATWSALEYACHVRDVCGLYDRRLHRMLDEDDPLYENWDQDETAVGGRYAEQDPAEVLLQLTAGAEKLAASFDSVSGDQWQRPGRRSDGAVFTIDTFSRYLLHDVVHHGWDVTGVEAGDAAE